MALVDSQPTRYAPPDHGDAAGVALLALDERRPLTQRIVDGISRRMDRRSGRRSFLARSAVVGSALAVGPIRFLVRPVGAEESICGPDNECSQGWTVFCCSINEGRNSCPPGSVAAGWWKADGSPFCEGGARYYLDCNAVCHDGCECGAGGICAPGCHDWNCHCGENGCDRRRVACNAFRYGQCHQELACVGPVVCRVVSCVPPWQWEPSCTPEVATANATRFHHAPCLEGGVSAFGSAASLGAPGSTREPIVGIESTASGDGYWLVSADGGVYAFGDAPFLGSAGNLSLNAPVVDIGVTPTADGYWLVSADGGIFSYGKAQFYGSAGGIDLVAPIVGMSPSPSGHGYSLAALDGGVFAFGDARFFGSMGGAMLAQPVVGIAATPSGGGYWLAARDGGVFAFGDAQFHGSEAGSTAGAPIVAICATASGDGYWLAAADGAVFAFGDAQYHGGANSTGSSAFSAAVDLDATPFGDGYWMASTRT